MQHAVKVTVSILAAIGLVALGGCASFSADGGFGAVQRATRERIAHDVVWARDDAARKALDARIDELLAQPLTVDAAVQAALLNNPSLQASYADLGIAESEFVQAGRLPNPTFSFSRLAGGGEVEIERTLLMPIVALLTLPSRTRIAEARFEQAQLRAASEVLRNADETRRAWFTAVAARQTVGYMELVRSSADAGAELSQRMAAAGNWSKLRQAQEQSFLAEATARLAVARQGQVGARERLARLLGVSNPRAADALPERLPDLPAAPREVADAENQALANRLDVLLARRELDVVGRSLGLTRATRFVDALSLGPRHDTKTGEPSKSGYEVELEVPVFDFGRARVANAEAVYLRSVARLAESTVDARSEVREAYAGYRSAYELARHYRDEVVPLAKRVSDEQLLRYNGMLASVFELLADARAQAAAVNASIDALRDFWIADSALQMALNGRTAVPATRSAADVGPPVVSASH
jgi:outer membrane protein TolC